MTDAMRGTSAQAAAHSSAAALLGRAGEAAGPDPAPAMEKPKRRSLRRKFLTLMLSIVVVFAVVLFSVSEYIAYKGAMRELERKVDEIADIQSSIVAVSVWNLEQDLMKLVLDAILKDDDFVMALISDENGGALARAGRISDDEAETYATTSSILFENAGRPEIIGELTLVATDHRIRVQMRNRLVLNLAVIVLLLAVAIAAAGIAFGRTIETPLSRLLTAIYRAKNQYSRQKVVWYSDDEMGFLVREFNDMQEQQSAYEEALKSARDNLDLRVQERTSALRAARDEADAANRAKSDFLAVMSHELRTPLNGILGLADTLSDDPLSSLQKQHLDLLKGSGWSLMGLLNDLLDLSKIESGQLELEILTVDLDSLLTRVLGVMGPIIESRGVKFELKLPQNKVPLLRTDPTRLRQVILNLLNNAVKFTEEGVIQLRVSHERLDADRLRLLLEVWDTGLGIDPDVQDSLFGKFTQADTSTTRRFGGTGLGLSICKELVTLLGGEIGVSSRIGEGSRFWFSVPCERGDASQLVEDSWGGFEVRTLSAESLAAPLSILVAEDNKVNRLVIQSMLGGTGHDLVFVHNGAEAVEAVAGGRFDLVLMDVQMPVMDGMTATREIRRLSGRASKIPIVALTANAMRGDREKYLDCGMNDYVPKPIERDLLEATIARIAGQAACPAPANGGGGQQHAQPAADVSPTGVEAEFEMTALMRDLDKLST